jgi:hypothetical protein
LGKYYLKRYKLEEFSVFKNFEFGYILYFIIFTLAIVGARGGVRLVMVLAAVSPVAVGFLIMKTGQRYSESKGESSRFFAGVLLVIIILLSGYTLWNNFNYNKSVAETFYPSAYNVQWQEAMSWVRENTSQDAVFAHWWDYGYWVQSLGERATVLDGSNSIVYWNYLMGRNVLTGTNEIDMLEFLYAHNVTNLLIDSTDIGKYTAYSSIGSDENYDRFSWISTFLIDNKQTYETATETNYVYLGGSAVDEDIIWNVDGRDVLFPEMRAVIGGVILKTDKNNGMTQPEGIFIYQNKQYNIPLRYIYYENEMYDFGSGIEAGIFLFPSVDVSNGFKINPKGAMLYLSRRTLNSNLAKYYLFGEETDSIKLAHQESSYVISNLRQQGVDFGEFLYYQGFQGPIKIWDVNYPWDIEFKEEYLETKYPDPDLLVAQPGKYNN